MLSSFFISTALFINACTERDVGIDTGKGLTVCNESLEAASVAIGKTVESKLETSGWYQISVGECKQLLTKLTHRNYLIYGQGERGTIWDGDQSFCIDPKNAFTITSHLCPIAGGKKVQFLKIDTGESRAYTYQLTGGKPSKLSQLDIGDGVYVQGYLTDELSQIVRIDQDLGRVKVRRGSDATTIWVTADKILTREESLANDVNRVGAGVAVFLCALNPEAKECQSK